MNYHALVRRIRACEGEAAAQLLLEHAIHDLVDALHPFAIEFEIADAAGELQHWPPNEVKNCEAAWRALRK